MSIWLLREYTNARNRFKRLLRSHGGEPRKIVTDKLRSYGVAHRELMPDVIHDNSQYANHRGEQSHEATRVRERVMRVPGIPEVQISWAGSEISGCSCCCIKSVQLG